MPLTVDLERIFDWRRLRKKKLEYWLRVLVATLLGVVFADLLGHVDAWNDVRYAGYGWMQDLAGQRAPTFPKRTAVVLIDDEDFWKGELARRTPLKRRYLGDLLERIAAESPSVVALDVDLSAQVPDGSLRWHPDYDEENRYLLTKVNEIAERKVPVVLAKNVYLDSANDRYVEAADIFDGALSSPRVRTGYTLLPHDIRQVAMLLTTDRRKTIDSFAVAVARIAEPRSVLRALKECGTALPYGFFLTKEKFGAYWMTAAELRRRQPGTVELLRGRAVIVGGAWSRLGYRRGDLVDSHLTPVGVLPGAVVQANYVETLLSETVTPPLGTLPLKIIDLLFGGVLACIFVGGVRHWKAILIAGCFIASLLLSIVFWQNFGLFVDALPLVVILGGHALAEQVMEWKHEADEHRSDCVS